MFPLSLLSGGINKYLAIGIVSAVLVGFIGYKVYSIGYDNGYSVYTKYIADEQADELKNAKTRSDAEVKVITEYKDKVIYVEKKSSDIKTEVAKGVLNEESTRCIIGDNFVRLHNYSASN